MKSSVSLLALAVSVSLAAGAAGPVQHLSAGIVTAAADQREPGQKLRGLALPGARTAIRRLADIDRELSGLVRGIALHLLHSAGGA